jgi:sortase A
MEAPTIGLRQVVVEGTTSKDLESGPGHRPDTPLPGQSGASVIYGRAVAFGGPFGDITDLRPGDPITVTTGQGTFDYRVDSVRHNGDALPDPLRSGEGRLTLVTAEGTNWRTGWAPDRAVYVDASLQRAGLPAPAGRPTVVARDELTMASDGTGLVGLVLWLQLVLVTVASASFSQKRWGGSQTWLVYVPILIATLWGASESAMQLLPNLY